MPALFLLLSTAINPPGSFVALGVADVDAPSAALGGLRIGAGVGAGAGEGVVGHRPPSSAASIVFADSMLDMTSSM
jgi:hypothetical protein